MFSLHHAAATRAVAELAASRDIPGLPSDRKQARYDASLAAFFWHPDFGKQSTFTDKLLQESRRRKAAVYECCVFGLAPLYVTSHCDENCVYCNFRSENNGMELVRVRLTSDELDAETHFLSKEKGLYVIELVYASDSLTGVDYMCRHVESVKAHLDRLGGGCVGINAEALDEADYRRLVDAGLTFAVLWQETYNRERYVRLHPSGGKKARFEYRLDAPGRMLAGGVKHIGLGVLSGLSDWRSDWAMLLQHEAHLLKTTGQAPAILGIPRLKPAAGALLTTSQWLPSTSELVSLVALHNLFAPETCPFINTREDWETCLALAQGGGCLFTLNCKTIPGGYSLNRSGYQFPTDSFDAPECRERLRSKGLVPVYSWSFGDMGPKSTERGALSC